MELAAKHGLEPGEEIIDISGRFFKIQNLSAKLMLLTPRKYLILEVRSGTPEPLRLISMFKLEAQRTFMDEFQGGYMPVEN